MGTIERVIGYLDKVSQDPLDRWMGPALVDASNLPPPGDILPRHDKVLLADTYALWFRWFIDGVCNPLRYVHDDTKTIVDVLADTQDRVETFYGSEPEQERKALARAISTHVMLEVARQRQIARVNASRAQRRELIENVLTPRCWMCGFAFSGAAVQRFMKSDGAPVIKQPDFVDIFRPRGLFARDVTIEVEHKVPVAAGGGGTDNLALACGWCNKTKGAKTGVYEASGRPPRVSFTLGAQVWHELPHPFWTARLVATRRICESTTSCGATADNAEMFVAPTDYRGSPNPSTLRVYCAQHDPYANTRFFGREAARKIWKARK